MNATPKLDTIAAALAKTHLEAVLIGNAAAAIQGAPVTTVDFDFMFQDTAGNLAKLKKFARLLDAVILRPYYPASKFYRVVNDETQLQADFMPVINAVKSFDSLRSRATRMKFGGHCVWVAHLADVILSKQAMGRARDKAALKVIERTFRRKNQQPVLR